MSDFLSKFNKDNYEDLVNEQEEQKATSKKKSENQKESKQVNKQEKQLVDKEAEEKTRDSETSHTIDPESTRSRRDRDTEVEIEIDPDYQRKKKLRMWLVIVGSIVACIFIFFIYYLLVHVKVEDFTDKPVSEARTWAKENGVEVELEQEYHMEFDANQIVSQSVPAGKKIRKGKTLQLVSSLGPDPEDVIPLADFSEMSQEEAENWISEHKAENLQMVTEYNDDLEEGEFIKFTIKDSSVDESSYKRKDSAAVYYSKGKEVFEKNITVPDFNGMTKEEVEKWAESNEIDMTYKEGDSDTIEAGSVISQSVEAEEKVAKKDQMEVVVSVGQATVVPNFGEMTAEEAAMNYPDLDVTVKQVYHADVAYGRLISQSVEADTKLTDNDDKRVTVVYSEGRPYLQDFRGQSEGDLPRLFYEQYQSKGADINYIVKYVDSHEVKGTVVDMGNFNEFVAMTYTVEIRISNNASAPPDPPDFSENEPNWPIEGEEPEGPIEDGDEMEDIEK